MNQRKCRSLSLQETWGSFFSDLLLHSALILTIMTAFFRDSSSTSTPRSDLFIECVIFFGDAIHFYCVAVSWFGEIIKVSDQSCLTPS